MSGNNSKDIFELMGINRKPFLALLDGKKRQISEVWNTVDFDYSSWRLSSEVYCRCSYAITLTINYKKAFPKSVAPRSAESQKNMFSSKIKCYLKNKECSLLLYWELSPTLRLHAHGVIIGFPAMCERVKKYLSRSIGHVLIKPIDNPDKWREYCEKDLYRNRFIPSMSGQVNKMDLGVKP